MPDFTTWDEPTDDHEVALGNLGVAYDVNPDERARQAVLARKAGVPPVVAQHQEKPLTAQVRSRDNAELLKKGPGTAAFLAKHPEHAALSHDIVGPMLDVEELGRRVRELARPKPTLGSYGQGLATSFAKRMGMGIEGLIQSVGDAEIAAAKLFGADEVASNVEANLALSRERYRNLNSEVRAATPAFKTKLWSSVYGGVESTVAAVPSIAATIATRSPAVGLGMMGTGTGGVAYGKYRERGGTAAEATAGGVLEGSIEAATELIPMGFLVKRFGTKGVKSFVAGLLGREMAGEQIATLSQDAVDTAIANPDKTWKQFMEERPEAAFDTAVGVVVQGGIMGGASAAMSRIASRDLEAERAAGNAKAFSELAKQAAALPLRERSPEAFDALMGELAPGLDVHVNAGVLGTYLQSIDPDEASALTVTLGIADQLQSATPQADIVIPARTYITEIAPTDLHAVLEKDLKLGPAALSVNEAEEHKADREMLLAEAAAKAFGQETGAEDTSVERVRQDFYDKAVLAGVPDAQAQANAAVQASYYAQRAARNPTYADAWAAYEDAGIEIEAGGVAPKGDVFTKPSGAISSSTFKQTFEEAGLTQLAAEADEALSGEAKRAIDNFIGLKPNALADGALFGLMSARELEAAVSGAKPEVFDELEAAFKPVREQLRRVFGDTVRLHRVQEKVKSTPAGTINMSSIEDGTRSVLSWTLDRGFGEWLAGIKPPRTPFTETQIKAFEKEYEETGRAQISKKVSLRKETLEGFRFDNGEPFAVTMPMIYVYEEAITDADSVRAYLEEKNQEREEFNEDQKQRQAKILTADVPLDEVVWISDRAGQAEFIVQNRKEGVFIDPAGRLTVPEKTEPEEPPVFEQRDQTETPEFQKWFGDSKVVDASGDPLVVYHGTTGDFESFDKGAANPESDLGAGFYFSNTPEDVANNYAGEGPDLTQRLQLKAERIADETDRDYDDPEVLAEAREALRVEHGGMTLPVYLAVQKPVMLGGRQETFLSYEESYDEETDEYGEPEGDLVLFVEKLRDILESGEFYDAEADETVGKVFELAMDDQGLSARRLFELAKESSDERSMPLMYATDENGNMAGTEIVRRALEAMGFDGIIDKTVDTKFGSARVEGVKMQGVTGATTHYVVFAPEQIKSAIGNEGTFDASNPSILKQGPRGQVSFTDQGALVQLFKGRNASTLIHEASGHIWLDNLARDAADPNSSDEVRADLETVKAWWRANAPEGSNLQAIEDYGVKDVDVDAIRPFHEMFARAAERYFMEGRAPNSELRAVFAKLRQWLVAIYKDFTKLNVPMSDDIRSVFDRLVAVPGAIEDAKDEQALEPMTPEQGQALGMTPAEYGAYLNVVKLADEAAHDRLLGKVMADIRRKRTAAWKSEREALIAEHQETVNALPEMQALTLLETGAVRLERQAIIDAGFDEAGLYRRSRPYVFGEGVHPDALAEQVGLTSGEALLNKLVEMKAEHDALRAEGDKRTVRLARAEEMADAEMLARHGDVLNDGTIGDEAISAIHDMRRSEVMMTEVRALVRKAGALTAVWSPEEMQAWAVKQIAGRQLNGIRPHVFKNAEAKAGRDALKALIKDDFPAALDAKFRQLLNLHLYRAARDARDEVEKGKTLFDRIAKARNGTITKTRDMDMVSAARTILSAYGFGAAANDADYMAKVALYDPELWADLRDGVTAALAGARPLDELTYDQFESLRDMVSQLWEMSRTSRQMQVDLQTLETEDIAGDLAAQLRDAPPPAGPTHNPTGREIIARTVSSWRAHLRRVESWVTYVDGGPKGPFRTYVWNPISEAATRYRTAKRIHLDEFVAILEPMRLSLKRGKIDAPELNHVFGGGNNGVGKSELLHAILHTGNESNKRKLLLGRGWATEDADGNLDTSAWDRFITRMHDEGTLTQADYDFAQSVWDLLERMKPDAQRAHRQVFGRYFEEVTATAFTTPFGKYAGGYVPALADTFLVQDAALRAGQNAVEEGNSANMFPSPARGFTKARVEYNKPLALDLGLLPMHIDSVLKFSHLTAPVRDVLRLLKEKGLSAKLEALDPTAVTDMLLPWLNRAARQVVQTPSTTTAGRKVDGVLRAIRSRSGMGIMMFNVSNTMQQLTGWVPAALKVKKRHLTRALWTYARNPDLLADSVAAASPFMATRTVREMIDTGAQLDNLLLDPSKFQKFSDFSQRHAYVLQGMFQNMVDLVAWQASFEQALERGEDFTEAVRSADNVIRETQGSLSPEDVSAWETGSALKRMFTIFFSYFSAQGNLIATEGGLAVAQRSLTRAGYVYLMGVMLPAVASEIIRRSFGAGWDDEDDDGYLDMLMDVFFGSQFRYATGALPVLGQLVNLAANQFNDKRFDDQLVPSPALSTVQSAATAPKSVYKALAEGKGQKAAVRDTATLLTLATGIPLFAAAGRPLGYLADINEGKVEPTSPVDFARGLMTGTASAASKEN